MLDNNARKNVENYFIVNGCRGCGRSYWTKAPVAEGNGDGVRARCGECGATNVTREYVAHRWQIAEVLEQ